MSNLKQLLQENTLDIGLDVKPIYEAEFNLEGKKVKKLKIMGTCIVTDVPGINGRSYPKRILKPEVDRFVAKYMNKGRAAAELNHPRLDDKGNGKDYSVFEMNLNKTCALIEQLYFTGNDLFVKMRVCESHDAGRNLKSLIDDGYVPGFSLRGAGSVIDTGMGYNEITEDYRLITIDVVGNPSFDEKALITPAYEAVIGQKIQLLTESVETERREMMLNAHPETIRQIKTGRNQFSKDALISFLESNDLRNLI